MKKITKGAIAAGAAALLLAGGAGTFMEWNQDTEVAGGGINSGLLTLEAPTEEGTWTLNGEEANISAVEIVPGDVLQLVQPIVINAEGDNIEGELSLGAGSITPTGAEPASTELASALNDGASFILDNASEGLTGGPDGTLSFDGAGTYDADLTVTLDFGFDSVTDLVAQDGSVNLSGTQVAVVQTDASPAGTEPEIEP